MQNTKLIRTPLSAMIALTLATSLPNVSWATDAPCDEEQSINCEPSEDSKGRMGWWLGGIAALAGTAGLAGGGGSGGGNDGGQGPGAGPAPGSQGGQYGNNGQLVGVGNEATWQDGVETRVTGRARNDGRLQLQAGMLSIRGEGHLLNQGVLQVGPQARVLVERDGELENRGQFELRGYMQLNQDGSLDNFGTFVADSARIEVGHDSDIENLGSMTLTATQVSLSGESEFDNGERRREATLSVNGGGFALREMAEFDNHGVVNARGVLLNNALFDVVSSRVGGERDAIEAFNNHGAIHLAADARVLSLQADSHAASAVNRHGAEVRSSAAGQSALHASGGHATVLNQGTITITGERAVAMSGERGAVLINDGVINLGEVGGSHGQGMVAMQSDGSATLNNRRGGVINIHADNSFAFKMGATGGGRLINNGTVNVYGQGSGMNADAATGSANLPGADLGWQAPRGVSGYTVGTNADGSAGQLVLHQGGTLSDVQVDTGFTRGTNASQVQLDAVFMGADGGEHNIRSASVVWQANAQRDGDGNVDVTMTRNDYRLLALDAQAGVAAALELGYDSNALFHSLEVATATELHHAIDQLSGAGIDSAHRSMLANGDAFWSSLARQAVQGATLLSFGGDATARHGVSGTGMGLRSVSALKTGQQLGLTAGMLSTDGLSNGGQGRGMSRFAGLSLGQSLGGLELQHTLGLDQHQLDGQRSLQWSGTNSVGYSQRALSRSHIGSLVQRSMMVGGVQLTPRAGATAYRVQEAAFSEIGNGLLGLSVSSGAQSGVQWEAGAGLAANLGARWTLRGDAALMGHAAYRASSRVATLHGAAGQSFRLPTAENSGTDYRLLLGADFRHQRLQLGASLMAERVLGKADASASFQLGYRY
jgi:hypothetical protein